MTLEERREPLGVCSGKRSSIAKHSRVAIASGRYGTLTNGAVNTVDPTTKFRDAAQDVYWVKGRLLLGAFIRWIGWTGLRWVLNRWGT